MREMISSNPVAPQSLNAAASGTITLPKGGTITVQACLFTNPASLVIFKLDDVSTADAVDLDDMQGVLGHGGTVEITLPPGQMYLYWALVDATGTADTGGANDRIAIVWSV